MAATNTPKHILRAAFIEKAIARHGDKYDYSRVDYQNNSTKVCVVCPEHGEFWPRPNNHYNGSGCPKCAGTEKVTNAVFVERARKAHGDKYDYSKADIKGVDEKVCIICPEHGEFWQTPTDHTGGHGCKACGVEKCAASNRHDRARFIERAIAKFGDKIDYRRVVYTNSTTDAEFICREHGSFIQTPNEHLASTGCPKCSSVAPVSREDFIERAREVHGHRYDYSASDFTTMHRKCAVFCHIHGTFQTLPKDHIAKRSGCPRCARESTASRGESELAAWIESAGFRTIRNDRDTLSGFEVDIFIPDIRLGIEYNGAYWHSDTMLPHRRAHEIKQSAADKAGIRLITVWDYQWQEAQERIKRHILHAAGMSKAPRIDARKCAVVPVSFRQASDFYDAHHLQGHAWRSMINLGLMHDGELVGAMSFTQSGSRRGKTGNNEWELQRFATSAIVRGGASKLMARFVAEHTPGAIWSFSDRQHFSGGLYNALGFKHDGYTAADYSLYHQGTGRRWHKSAWQRKHIPARLRELGINEAYDPQTDPRTEREMQSIARVIRVMDSGKIRWKWTKKEVAEATPL